MDISVASMKDYKPVSRGRRGSQYDKTVADLFKLPPGKFLQIKPEKGETLKQLRGRVYSGVMNVLKRQGKETSFSCTLQQDNTVALMLKVAAKKKPAAKKKAKKRARR